jgi:hypothetical protein
MTVELQVNYTLTIGAEKAALIPVIASMNGWTGEGTPEDFINANVVSPQVTEVMRQIVYRAVDSYFGLKDAAMANEVKAEYETAFEVTSEFVEVV